MSVQLSSSVVTTGIRAVEYFPAYIDGSGFNPAQVGIGFAGYVAALDLDIEDARELFHRLGVVLVEHAAAQNDPRGAWAVA